MSWSFFVIVTWDSKPWMSGIACVVGPFCSYIIGVWLIHELWIKVVCFLYLDTLLVWAVDTGRYATSFSRLSYVVGLQAGIWVRCIVRVLWEMSIEFQHQIICHTSTLEVLWALIFSFLQKRVEPFFLRAEACRVFRATPLLSRCYGPLYFAPCRSELSHILLRVEACWVFCATPLLSRCYGPLYFAPCRSKLSHILLRAEARQAFLFMPRFYICVIVFLWLWL